MNGFALLLVAAAGASSMAASSALADAPAGPVSPKPAASSALAGATKRRLGPASWIAHGTRLARSAEAASGASAPRITQASEVHPWWDGAVYNLATAPERVSDIVLQPGETLIAVAAGDTARWVIGDTTSGSGATRRTHILVKPAAPSLRTNLVITTDRRVYHLELASGFEAMTSIAWTYPQDELLALRQQSAAAAAAPVAASLAIDRLNFNYGIQGGTPAWRPIRAFDDGTQVFIEFPPALDSMEAPPLFVIGASGKAELVNYRKSGRYYIVDRLFEAAELRLGGEHQQIVRIMRGRARRGTGSAGGSHERD